MAIEPVVLIYDLHAPYHHHPAVSNAIAFIGDFLGRRSGGILGFGGDAYDFYLASNFIRQDSGKGPQLLVDELDWGWEVAVKPMVQAAGKRLSEKFALGGNHEARGLRLIAAAAPMLRTGIAKDWDDLMHYKEAGIKYIVPVAGNSVHALTSRLDVMHGWKHGVNAPRASLIRYGKSLVIGHTHKAGMVTERQGAGHTLTVLSSGCLSATNPEYVSMPDWTWGFIAGWVNKETGEFSLHHCTCAGDNLELLYTPWGNYHATKHKTKNGERWESKRNVWF